MKLKRVDHLAFVVTDLDRSVKFYQQVFDGEVGRSRGQNEKDKAAKRSQHTLVKVGEFGFDLFQMEPGDPPKTSTRHLHFAFEIDPADLDKVEEQLKRMGIPYDGPKGHGGGSGLSIYFNDPDGYQLEATAKFPDAAAYEAEIRRRGATYGGMGNQYDWKNS
ncbi:MAG TPA: VOC family protein [Verrucomicrobiae bacterium]|jgi:metallothiol transferase|nr:VOC family protein [Verrucomicrobiae bacterium]